MLNAVTIKRFGRAEVLRGAFFTKGVFHNTEFAADIDGLGTGPPADFYRWGVGVEDGEEPRAELGEPEGITIGVVVIGDEGIFFTLIGDENRALGALNVEPIKAGLGGGLAHGDELEGGAGGQTTGIAGEREGP